MARERLGLTNADVAPPPTGRRSALVLNAGSSSLKFAIFDAAQPSRASVRGEIENVNEAPHFWAVDGQGAPLAGPAWPARGPSDFAAIIDILMKFVADRLAGGRLIGVGHRVVHGGADHGKPERITPALLGAAYVSGVGVPVVVVVLAAMPSGINSLLLGHAYGLDLRLIANCIVWSTGLVLVVALAASVL